MKILQRYVFKEFLKYFLILTFTFYFIYVLGNFIDKIAHIKNFILSKVVLYYLYQFPDIFNMLLPLILLFSIILSIGNLGRQNEMIVMGTAGIDPKKITMPIYIFVFLLSILTYFNCSSWGPKYKFKSYQIFKIELQGYVNYLKVWNERNIGIVSEKDEKLYLFSNYYDSKKRILIDPIMLVLDDNLLLKKRIDAKKGIYLNEGNWKFTDIVMRNFDESEKLIDYVKMKAKKFALSIKPELFNTARTKPVNFTSKELSTMIKNLRAMGRHPVKFLVEYFGRTSYPVFIFIVVLFAIPLGLSIRKDNMGKVLGYGLIFIIVYITLFRFTYTLGIGGKLSPIIAAWLSNILFIIYFIYSRLKKNLIL